MNRELSITIFIFIIIAITGINASAYQKAWNQYDALERQVPTPRSNEGIHKEVNGIGNFKNTNFLRAIEKESLKKKKVRVEIISVGDIMCHSPQFRSVYKEGKYNFTPWFEKIKQYIEGGDIAIANLETTFSGKEKRYSGYPRFNCPEELGSALKEAGFDIITTANNHSLDRNNYGIINTLDELDKLKLRHTGTYRNKEEREKLLIENIQGIRIAFISYTYGTNGIPMPKNNPYAVNIIDKEKMTTDINKAKNNNVDMIIFSLHFGQEYQRKQSKKQEELVDFLFKNGVDIILGSHPHVLQSSTYKEVKTTEEKEKKGFVIYSQGNFISNQRSKYRDSGLITSILIEKNFESGKTDIVDVSFIPTWVDKSYLDNSYSYRILPVEEGIKDYNEGKDGLISKKDYERLKEVLIETKTILKIQN